jgi:hypothetical protein
MKMTLPQIGEVEATEVGVTETVERWTEVRLEDGSVLRVKPAIIKVFRLDGKFDPQGNPMYALQGGQVLLIHSAPDHLRQGRAAGNPTKVQ